ncbi:hypothetical protein GCM10010466_53380 [Planomonospora alba]|uniref:Uncharacterized protein n=1 Tax=Planomonospora alba TaxID=161354 RepID=A0ABP6NQV1_9ACTN
MTILEIPLEPRRETGSARYGRTGTVTLCERTTPDAPVTGTSNGTGNVDATPDMRSWGRPGARGPVRRRARDGAPP